MGEAASVAMGDTATFMVRTVAKIYRKGFLRVN